MCLAARNMEISMYLAICLTSRYMGNSMYLVANYKRMARYMEISMYLAIYLGTCDQCFPYAYSIIIEHILPMGKSDLSCCVYL